MQGCVSCADENAGGLPLLPTFPNDAAGCLQRLRTGFYFTFYFYVVFLIVCALVVESIVECAVAMVEFQIRDACESDLASVRDIYSYFVENTGVTFELEVPSLVEMKRRFNVGQQRRMPWKVAVIPGELSGKGSDEGKRENDDEDSSDLDLVVGYAYLSSFRERPAYNWSVEHSIFLRRGYERMGIGSALVRQCLLAGKERGFRQVFGVSGDYPDTIALHRRAGFELVGTWRNVGYKFGQWLDRLNWQLSLDTYE